MATYDEAAAEKVNATLRGTTDPVFQCDTGWHFFDETWSDTHGPFPDEETARSMLKKYAAAL